MPCISGARSRQAHGASPGERLRANVTRPGDRPIRRAFMNASSIRQLPLASTEHVAIRIAPHFQDLRPSTRLPGFGIRRHGKRWIRNLESSVVPAVRLVVSEPSSFGPNRVKRGAPAANRLHRRCQATALHRDSVAARLPVHRCRVRFAGDASTGDEPLGGRRSAAPLLIGRATALVKAASVRRRKHHGTHKLKPCAHKADRIPTSC